MRKVFICLMAALTAVSAWGGESLGAYVKGGFNLSNYVQGQMPHGMKAGGHVGAGYEYRFNRHWGLATELYMSFQGAKFDHEKIDNINLVFETEDGSRIDRDITLNAIYFELPVLAKFYVVPQLSIDLGPQFGIAAQNNLKMGDVKVLKMGRSFETWNVSVSAGMTWNVTSRLMIQARYNRGLTKVMKSIEVPKYAGMAGNTNFDDRIQNIQLSVGYRF